MRKFFLLGVAFSLSISLYAQKRTYDTVPYILDHWHKRMSLFEKEKTSKGRIVFLGNSITEGGDWKKLFKDTTIINRGIGGDITFGVLSRLSKVTELQPSKLFLKIGINDISKNIPDEVIIENIFSIVKRVRAESPETQVFVQSILPTNNTYKTEIPQHYNKDEHVVMINSQLKKFSDRIGYTFIDLFPLFQDKEGKLDSRYTHDGLHLNAAGYQKWAEILKNGKYL